MKNRFLLLVGAVVLSACSGTRYTASFRDYQRTHQYDSISKSGYMLTDRVNDQPVILASVSHSPILSATNPTEEKVSVQSTKKENKKVIKQLKADIKHYVKQEKKLSEAQSYKEFEWDNDLKLAVIFGAAGLVGVLLGGISVVFSIIGGIALIIGVVFFVQWVLRQ